MEDEGMNVEDNSVNKDIGPNPNRGDHTEKVQQVDGNSTRMDVNMPVVDTNDSRDEVDSSGKVRSSTHDGIKPMGVHSAAKVVDAGSYEDTNTGSKPACGVGNGTMLASMQSGPNLFDDTYRTENGVENSDIVLPRNAIDKVKNKYENSLVGYFIGKSLAFPIVQNYVNNTWGKFGLQILMRSDDCIFLFKFADKRGMEQVLERGPWLIRNSINSCNKWTPSLPLRKDEVTKVPVRVKLHKVPLVAYSEGGLSFIATQIGKPLGFSHWVFLWKDTDLKEVIMAVPNEDETSYTREVISVAYKLQPQSDGFTEVKRKKNKGKKADQQPWSRHIDGIRLTKPKPNFYWQKTCANKSGADLINKGPTDANSSIIPMDTKGDQAVVHSTVIKHTSPRGMKAPSL
ncbi:nucleotide-binding alpha-beta plait domain-containing protein [Tanacetum coccineum]